MNRLEARSINKTYGATVALDHASLDATAGSVMCVIGPSGSGKSTLIRHLHLLEAPDDGEILVDGAAPSYGGRRWLHAVRRFALVQQKPGLLRAPAWQNAAFPLAGRGVPRAKAREEAAAWLRRLGLETRMDIPANDLSGGEAQRVALARALVTRPDFLLIDEGTNQLDPHTVRSVEAVIREQASRGCLVVMVTHNVPQTLRMADAFVFLDAGRVVEAGGRDLLAHPRTDELRDFLETGF